MGQEQTTKQPIETGSDIYTMPREFFEPLQVKSRGWLPIIIAAAVILLVFGGATAYVLLTRTDGVKETAELVQALPEDTVSEPQAPVIDEKTIIIQEPVQQDSVASTTQELFPVLTETPELLPSSIDLDGDGLTDIEETLLGIDPALPDTDGDGFFDGAELAAGYDPGKPSVDLTESPLFKIFINDSPNFSLQLPRDWTEERDVSKKDTVSFIALNNDAIRFTVVANAARATIDQWFQNTYPERSMNELTNRTVSGRIGKESIIRREVYIPIDAFVLVIRYDVGAKKEVAYPGIFEFILNSISF